MAGPTRRDRLERGRPAHRSHRHPAQRQRSGGGPQARRRSWPGEHFDLVLTSPLQRARDTAELAGFGAQAEVETDLREWDYGDYEGITTAEIREQRPGWTVFKDGCPGGETLAQVCARADRVIERVRAVEGRVLLFGHGHSLRILAARWIELPPAGGRAARPRHRHRERARLGARLGRDQPVERGLTLSRSTDVRVSSE